MTICSLFDIIVLGVDKMKDKFNLTLDENIFLAKRLIIDNIYSNARSKGAMLLSLKHRLYYKV